MKKMILVVDDEAVIRRILRVYLERMDYGVKEAADGVEAIEQIKRNKFDLIISDVIMPRKDGWEVLKEVKRNKETEDIPVILLTAKNEYVDMFKGYELNADYYMTKPFTRGQLVYGVKMMLEQDTVEIRL
jgi:two-component system alkaline phosphatase synthesis response regulator PhoP